MDNKQLLSLLEDSIEMTNKNSDNKLKRNLSHVKSFIQSFENTDSNYRRSS